MTNQFPANQSIESRNNQHLTYFVIATVWEEFQNNAQVWTSQMFPSIADKLHQYVTKKFGGRIIKMQRFCWLYD